MLSSLRTSARLFSPSISLTQICSFHYTPVTFKQLDASSVNPLIHKVHYAVRGEIVLRAGELEKQIKQGNSKLPFSQIIYCNIGNPQQLLQNPISFHRQVLACIEYPELMNIAKDKFRSDVIARAGKYLEHLNINGTGPYCHSQGVELVREEIANYIGQRDGFKGDPNEIYLTNGASSGVDLLLRLTIRNPSDGIMIPIPQYPLYSASIPMYNGATIRYYLDEEKKWGLSISELERSYKEAKSQGILPRGLVVINPGNPTGQVLSRSDMEDIVRFCVSNDVILMADEVYQDNVYNGQTFCSFRKVAFELGVQDQIQLVSFHSISKGFLGECGKRGGYFELLGFDKGTKEIIYKLASISLCSNVTGQIMMGLGVNPPNRGDPSFEEYENQKNSILQSLERRSQKLVKVLNSLEGVSCQPADGAMYAFPQISLPKRAVEEASIQKKSPDMLYSLELLENTGICVVPGSGFGQRDGTYHFRTTFLPKEENMDEVNQRLTTFHNNFMNKYR